jgi:hypothetical protein
VQTLIVDVEGTVTLGIYTPEEISEFVLRNRISVFCDDSAFLPRQMAFLVIN